MKRARGRAMSVVHTSTSSRAARRSSRKSWWTAYNAYLASEAWSKFREGWFTRHPRTCCFVCGASRQKRRLELHHVTYERVGQERDDDVRAMCKPCHDEVHRIAKSQRMRVYEATYLVRARFRRSGRY